ncbi:MAG: acetyl-CoA carboxylase biotin carboxyl carrier protein [Candidatus Omnitrophica bacterium]|nr:acetyl-CoA carboxylase biotin carboxyl carrier protein [Candidatus Omnitrophota bacterium]MCM8810638.1 acetyl-CoA carboxylase biotin carboxyl carrier protein [Candidatus Omnitrophota bacterium]
MKPEELKIYADFMKEYDLEYLEVKKGDFHLILGKKGTEIKEKKFIESSPKIDIDKIVEESKYTTQEIENIVYVKSPLVGTFYRAPSPTSPPFVEQGKPVKKGDVLCIVEAMKVMNEIKSDCDGIVKDILVKNGEPVEYGQVLFIIEVGSQ